MAGNWHRCSAVKHFTKTLTIASAVVSGLLLILIPVSDALHLPDFAGDGNSIDPNASVAIGSWHFAISRGGVWLFNDELPYVGSVIGLDGTWDGKRAFQKRNWNIGTERFGALQVSFVDSSTGEAAGRARYGDLPGFYYRYFEWASRKTSLWTLAVSLWYPAALFAVLPSWQFMRRVVRQKRFGLRELFVVIGIVAVVLAIAVT
jgi:hypothetical protein